MEDRNYTLKIEDVHSVQKEIPQTTLYMSCNNGTSFEIHVDKKFNWFQKKMIKWCFGFEVKENK